MCSWVGGLIKTSCTITSMARRKDTNSSTTGRQGASYGVWDSAVCWLEGEAWVETVLNKPEAPDFEHNIYAQFMPGAATFMHRLYPADYTVISSEKERKEPMTSTMMDSTVFRHIFSS